ncbi:hypothetical protein AVEN_144444-1 [Araneus ventricosus]|uniref:PiggyBac transposable element-derived protein domain-containing protein n=1 Tax=Araneus ventricosus TaxID=182803 RepID=A0A4Y2E133_ARAVE|nr:hypothetical protein AVEN_144444-1 [Araneus ventricosus]
MHAFCTLPDSWKSTDVKTLKYFRIDIISLLMLMGEEATVLKRSSTSSPSVAIKRNMLSVPEETRFQNVQHMPIKYPPQRCALCSTKKNVHKTRRMCKTSNV